MTAMVPGYRLIDADVFRRRIAQAREILTECVLCPRACRVNRCAGEPGACGAGAALEVAHWQVHYGEEPPLSDNGGAGAVFFSHCNLHCVYCQNHQISQQPGIQHPISTAELSRIMISLQEQGAQNIDLVSPSHFLPQILSALFEARQQGLRLPIVYNTNGYESEPALALLDGLVDIYLPDFKYGNDADALRYSQAPDYVAAASRALRQMHAQVGDFVEDEQGRACRGLLVRHLVLPQGHAASKTVLDILKKNVGTGIGLSVMSQYAPCYRASRYPELNRPLTPREYDECTEYVQALGFTRCWIQELESNNVYFPDFSGKDVFKDNR
ncbi:MAG: radical SAM protein [Candidatus Omnitrophica bacterium]|nr:radical SAM protein [Candidatus Omnitrophota bacterium]